MKNIFLLVIIALLIGACTNFLDEKSTGTMAADSPLSSLESCTALANGPYSNLTVFDQNEGTWGGNTIWLLEFMTGKVNSEAAQAEFIDYRTLTLNSRSRYIQMWWQNCYAGIAKANLAIQKIPEFTQVPETTRSKLMGEVRFLRALYYFYLVRIFGDLPKVDIVQTQLSELYVERSPVKTIYDEIIIPDLLVAEGSALPVKDETGRVSMGAVKALLADVYLNYAGYPINAGNPAYVESAKRSAELINANTYSLYTNYSDLRLPTNNNKKEFIFQVQFSLDKTHNDVVAKVLPPKSDISVYSSEYGSLVPTEEFYNSFATGDKRAEERQFFFSWHPANSKKTSDPDKLQRVDFGGQYIFKFFDETAVTSTGKATINWTLYRYADILLMYAEAQAAAEGTANDLALESLNKVRKRANLLDFTITSGPEFIKAVWDERYFELCFEGKIWFDQARTRKIRNDITGSYDDYVGYKTVYGATMTEKFLLFPIPQSELNANPSLTQNPNY